MLAYITNAEQLKLLDMTLVRLAAKLHAAFPRAFPMPCKHIYYFGVAKENDIAIPSVYINSRSNPPTMAMHDVECGECEITIQSRK